MKDYTTNESTRISKNQKLIKPQALILTANH